MGSVLSQWINSTSKQGAKCRTRTRSCSSKRRNPVKNASRTKGKKEGTKTRSLESLDNYFTKRANQFILQLIKGIEKSWEWRAVAKEFAFDMHGTRLGFDLMSPEENRVTDTSPPSVDSPCDETDDEGKEAEDGSIDFKLGTDSNGVQPEEDGTTSYSTPETILSTQPEEESESGCDTVPPLDTSPALPKLEQSWNYNEGFGSDQTTKTVASAKAEVPKSDEESYLVGSGGLNHVEEEKSGAGTRMRCHGDKERETGDDSALQTARDDDLGVAKAPIPMQETSKQKKEGVAEIRIQSKPEEGSASAADSFGLIPEVDKSDSSIDPEPAEEKCGVADILEGTYAGSEEMAVGTTSLPPETESSMKETSGSNLVKIQRSLRTKDSMWSMDWLRLVALPIMFAMHCVTSSSSMKIIFRGLVLIAMISGSLAVSHQSSSNNPVLEGGVALITDIPSDPVVIVKVRLYNLGEKVHCDADYFDHDTVCSYKAGQLRNCRNDVYTLEIMGNGTVNQSIVVRNVTKGFGACVYIDNSPDHLIRLKTFPLLSGIQCVVPKYPEDLQSECKPDSYRNIGETCIFSCADDLQERTTLTCTETGVFNKTLPSCNVDNSGTKASIPALATFLALFVLAFIVAIFYICICLKKRPSRSCLRRLKGIWKEAPTDDNPA